MNKKDNSILYGLLAGLGLLIFYLGVLSIFQGIDFAFLNLRSLWYFIFPLAIGFGIQIGLYTSIKHTATMTGTIAGTGGVSAGSMVACCSHFLLNIIPIAGISGISLILMSYQKWFLGIGIIANIIGIIFMLNHRNKMRKEACH
ncbi:MAG: hypothetical protein Q8O84_01935 [Nanoarchaeota archaeon]|nr:hypothetical protein [Nanoarchaeota archaeon]